MKAKVKFLTYADIKKRYVEDLKGSNMALETMKALQRGDQIAVIEHPKLNRYTLETLLTELKEEIEFILGDKHIAKITGYTDLSDFDNGKLYCSVSIK